MTDDSRHIPDSSESGESSKSRVTHLVRILVSVVLVIVILVYLDVEEFFRAIGNVSPSYLFFVVGLVLIDRLIVVHKWNLLLLSRGVRVRFFQLFSVYTIAQLSGFVLPSTVGGDLFRIYSLKKYGISSQVVIASIMVERVIGFLSMLAIAVIALGASIYVLGGRSYQLASIAWTLGVAVLICVSLFFLVKHEGLNRKINSIAGNASTSKFIGKIHDVYNLCRDYRKDTALLVKVTAYTFTRQIVPIFINVLLAIALGIDASLLEVFVIVPIIVLASRLPISLDGIGVQEGLYVVLFGIVGVSPSQALLMSVAFRLVVLVTLIPFGLQYVISGQKLPKRNLARWQ